MPSRMPSCVEGASSEAHIVVSSMARGQLKGHAYANSKGMPSCVQGWGPEAWGLEGG